jgi:hypothetical protein
LLAHLRGFFCSSHFRSLLTFFLFADFLADELRRFGAQVCAPGCTVSVRSHFENVSLARLSNGR